MYTYLDRRTGKQSCLDLCLCSPDLSPILTISPLEDVGSDHLVLEIKAEIEPHKYSWHSTSRYKIKKETLDLFNTHHIQSSLPKPNDINTLMNDWMTRITQSADECLGTPVTPSTTNKKKTPWWNERCHKAVKSRRRARKIVEKHPTTENIEEYKKLSTEAKKTIKESKTESMQEYISSITHNTPSSQIWNKIKAFRSTYVPQTYRLEKNGTAILTAHEKANLMNDHFIANVEDDQE